MAWDTIILDDLTAYFWNERQAMAEGIKGETTYSKFDIIHPSVNALYPQFIVPNGKRGCTIKEGTYIKMVDSEGIHRVYGCRQSVVIDDLQTRMTGLKPQFSAATDYYIYLCTSEDFSTAGIRVSLNSTYPEGFDEYTSRKIGGFHTLCTAVGTISGHPLSGYAAGDILPASFWDLKHRPTCESAGMVYVDKLDFWADIYLLSGTGEASVSAYGGTISDTRSYGDFAEDLFLVGKRALSDEEFRAAAEGSNQGTVINGAADPVTTGGHVDSAGRRMVSNYGLEDCCGVEWQWLRNVSAMGEQTTDRGGTNVGYGGNGQDGTVAKGYTYYCNTVRAGGHWSNPPSEVGSRYRFGAHSVRYTNAGLGCRGCASSRIVN